MKFCFSFGNGKKLHFCFDSFDSAIKFVKTYCLLNDITDFSMSWGVK